MMSSMELYLEVENKQRKLIRRLPLLLIIDNIRWWFRNEKDA